MWKIGFEESQREVGAVIWSGLQYRPSGLLDPPPRLCTQPGPIHATLHMGDTSFEFPMRPMSFSGHASLTL